MHKHGLERMVECTMLQRDHVVVVPGIVLTVTMDTFHKESRMTRQEHEARKINEPTYRAACDKLAEFARDVREQFGEDKCRLHVVVGR